MERWVLFLFIAVAAAGAATARKFVISRINRMESFSSVQYTSSDGKSVSDIWNDMGNRRNFEFNDISGEDENISEMFTGLSGEETESILNEVFENE